MLPHPHCFLCLHCSRVPDFTWSIASPLKVFSPPGTLRGSARPARPALLASLARTHFLQLALHPEALVNHGLAAASGHRPRWADEEPDEGCGAHIQALRETEEARGLQPVHFRPGLIRHRHWRDGQNTARMSLEEGCGKFPSLFGKFKALSRYNVKLLVS